MIILIEHPDHGRTHVYSNTELQAHIDMGWEVSEEKCPVLPPRFRIENDIVQFKRKPGRPKRDQ